jgi:hypothetical protein
MMMTTTKMKSYVIQTDSFCYETEASSLNEAVAEAFAGEIAGVRDVVSLERKFARYVADGGWCRVDEDGERVLEIGAA